MARYELIVSTGDKVLVDHSAAGMAEFAADLAGKPFLVLTEITGATAGAARDVIIASSQITMIRMLGDQTTQGSNFRPKR
jgi:hypothetical protein